MKKFRKIHFVVFFVMVAMILAMPMTAYADSIYIESQDIIVNLKETPTRTVVEDKRGILSDEEIQQIEAAGERLKIYDVGLYVEMAEKSTCTQRYTNELSEKKFDELLNGKENSIMIVFSFYEDAGGYYAVHYDVQGDFREHEVNQVISGTYHDFKTDATWITGSFEQVIDYLTKVEDNLINADEIAEQKKEMAIIILKTFRIELEILAIVWIIYLIRKNKKNESEWQECLDKKEGKISSLTNEVRVKEEEFDKLKAECYELQEWKKNALDASPEIEIMISQYLAKKHANEFDKRFKKAKSFEKLTEMISEYDKMSDAEKDFVKLDVVKAREKHEALAQVEAEKATKILEEACSKSSDRHNRDSYKNAMNYYHGLPQCIRILIAAHLITTLTENHAKSEKDYKRYHSSSSSSYHSSSSSSFHSSGGFHSGTFGGGFRGGH